VEKDKKIKIKTCSEVTIIVRGVPGVSHEKEKEGYGGNELTTVRDVSVNNML